MEGAVGFVEWVVYEGMWTGGYKWRKYRLLRRGISLRYRHSLISLKS